jgi:hypothetical protein
LYMGIWVFFIRIKKLLFELRSIHTMKN